MGRAAVLCDSTSVCNACDRLVVGRSGYLRTTLAAVILDYMGLYCEASWTPGWGHLYVSSSASSRRNGPDRVLDCGDRLNIRHRRHVLFDPALRRDL